MISDADYARWLRSNSFGGQPVRRTVLLAADYYDTSVKTLYAANRPGFASEPTDAPPNTPYRVQIKDIPRFKRSVPASYMGRAAESFGDIVIDNSDGALDALLDAGFDGRNLLLSLGDARWPTADFRPLINGTAARVTARSLDQFTIAMRGNESQLATAITTNKFTAGPNLDKPHPVCFGQCFNVSPVLETLTTHTYRVHTGQINAITAVREAGRVLATSQYTVNLTAGTFTMVANPSGAITCDVQGHTTIAGYKSDAVDLMRIIATIVEPPSTFDNASFEALRGRGAVGYYSAASVTGLDVIGQMAATLGAWVGFRRDGRMQLGDVLTGTGTPVPIGRNDFSEIRISREVDAVQAITLGARRRWTVQKDGTAGSLTSAERDELAKEYDEAVAEASGVLTKFLLAKRPELQGTLFANKTDAAAQAVRNLNMLNGLTRVIELVIQPSALALDLGDRITFTDVRRLGLLGKTGMVISVEDAPLAAESRVEVLV